MAETKHEFVDDYPYIVYAQDDKIVYTGSGDTPYIPGGGGSSTAKMYVISENSYTLTSGGETISLTDDTVTLEGETIPCKSATVDCGLIVDVSSGTAISFFTTYESQTELATRYVDGTGWSFTVPNVDCVLVLTAA